MDTSKNPGIIINHILLENLEYRKSNPNLDLSVRYNVNVETTNQIAVANDEKSGFSIMTVKVIEQSSSLFSMNIIYSLHASVIEGQGNMPIKIYLENSAPATLYQFIRESVLSLSQKAGLPLILPPLNLSISNAQPQENKEQP